ncbi:hypothetical protein E1B28_011170 [Marasmius oreades]|uniref:alkaline phosphatase n=1 Tax=Marasmius oreades TaxID=181124 RepID=A0A9P7RTN5_9AGAR|nr:uncharacterized protein E1B28_011170 [Marasmius oreades]KAG7089490.1 hypothetical protein E1B28_011170 [Marasmius oreades]
MRSYLLVLSLVALSSAQTFKRLGTCPTLGCVFPPDQTDFQPGQLFDIRVEVHAPVNGSEAFANGVPDENFSLQIQHGTEDPVDVTQFFNQSDPPLEKWNFTYYEDLFARDNKAPTTVNVASKAYRALSLKKPGPYKAILTYYDTVQTVANWVVRDPPKKKKVKNVILFIGDGMTQAMITAARLLAHKSINGKYQSLMQLDQMEALGHQMTHSIDSFITDSANSATALYTGKKSTVNALNVFVDSSSDSTDDPKFETIAELFRRETGGPVGIVSTAFIADATPAALCAHNRNRNDYPNVVYEYLHGASTLPNDTLPWPTHCAPDVIFGGGAEQFIKGSGSPEGLDFYEEFRKDDYSVVFDKDQLANAGNDSKVLGIFSISNMAKWLDRNVFPNNLKSLKNHPSGDGTDATNQPGLKQMTLKAIDILAARTKKTQKPGFFLMSEAASIDKMMHVLDYQRALGELLELDDTVKATLEHLEKIGERDNTLVIVTADHGHGFDVFGGSDAKYLAAQKTDRKKRDAVGVYVNSGLSGYTVDPDSLPTNNTVLVGPHGPGFPVNWEPRYGIAAGMGANPDHREAYSLNEPGPRLPATASDSDPDDFVVNPKDQPDGFVVNGTLPVDEDQGVHSLTDVSVFAWGPGHEVFRGAYSNVEIFFKIADSLGLGMEEDGEDCD